MTGWIISFTSSIGVGVNVGSGIGSGVISTTGVCVGSSVGKEMLIGLISSLTAPADLKPSKKFCWEYVKLDFAVCNDFINSFI